MRLMIYEEWLESPNREDLTEEEERKLVMDVVKFAFKCAEKIKLPTPLLAKAIHIFHAFSKTTPFREFKRELYISVCEFIIAKYEKLFPNTLDECIKMYLYVMQSKGPKPFEEKYEVYKPDQKTLATMKEKFLDAELHILQTLGFDLDIVTPYTYIELFKKYPGIEERTLFKMASTFVNDSYYTNICLYFEPVVIAMACIYLAAHFIFKLELPSFDGKPWFKFLAEDLEFAAIEECSRYVKRYLENAVSKA